MTLDEAKLVLDNARPQTKEIDRQFYDDEDLNNALNMAIKALEQQPSEDKVSVEVYKQVSRERDIAIEQLKELGYGFGEKIRTSDDCVSRAEVNKLYDEYRPRLATHVSEFGDKLKALPSITPTETMPDNEQKVLVSPCFGRIF